MTMLMVQTLALLLAAYFVGAWLGCLVRRTFGAADEVSAPAEAVAAAAPAAVAARAVSAPATSTVSIAPPQRRPDPVLPKIETIERPSDAARFERALTGPGPAAQPAQPAPGAAAPAAPPATTPPAAAAPVATAQPAPKPVTPAPAAASAVTPSADVKPARPAAPIATAAATAATAPERAPGAAAPAAPALDAPRPVIPATATSLPAAAAQGAGALANAAAAAAAVSAASAAAAFGSMAVPVKPRAADAPAAAAAVAAAAAKVVEAQKAMTPPAPAPAAATAEVPMPPGLRMPSAAGASGYGSVAADVVMAKEPIVPSPAPAAVAAADATPVKPPAADDLTRIRAIDAALSGRLRALGVSRFSDIAEWRPGDVSRVSAELGFKGRIEQENWVEQAQILARGGDTHYSLERMRSASVGLASPSPHEGAAPKVELRSAFAEGAVAAAVPVAATAAAKSVLPSAASARDSLQRIAGVNGEVEKLLNVQGVTRFSQIAGWSADDANRFNRLLGKDGRVQSENWIEQAQILSRGGVTAYTRELDRGTGPAPVAPAPAAPRPAATPTPVAAVVEAAKPAAAVEAPAAATPARPPVSPAPITPPPAAAVTPPPAAVVTPAVASAVAPPAAAAPVAPAVQATAMPADPPRPTRLLDAIKETAQRPATAAGPASQSLSSLRSVRSEIYRPAEGTDPAAGSTTGRIGRAGAVDDLKRIRGVGVLIEKKLNSLGITTYEQVANWTGPEIDRISQVLDFKGRIERESWVEQARILAAGGQTEFSRRVDRGEVDSSRPKGS